MTFTEWDLTCAVLAGAGVGFLSGVFGLGGGFLIVPVLKIVVGLPIELAVGAGACQVLGPATTSLLARRVERRHFRFPLTMMGGLLVGVFAGVATLDRAKQFGADGTVNLFSRRVSFIDLIVLAVYFCLLLIVGLFVLWESSRARGDESAAPRGLLEPVRIPPFAELSEFRSGSASIVVIAWFGLAVGFLSGFLGMSGGLVLLPGLIYLLGIRTQQAVTSSLVLVWFVALQNTIAHAWHDHIDLKLVMALLVGGTIGARLGSDIGVKLAGRKLRSRFGWLLIFTAAIIAMRLVLMVAG